MTDGTNQNSDVEAVAPPVNQDVNEQQNTQHDDEAKRSREEADERNFKAMRLKNADLERRLREREEMLDKVLHAQLANGASQKQQEVDEFADIGEEEFIPKGKVERLVEKKAQKYAEEIARREVEKHIKQQRDSQFIDRLKHQYSDFSEIVNPETLSLLEEREPELAQTIAELKDPYKIGMQSYKYIKALGIAEKAPEARRQREVEKALEKSKTAIQSPAAFDKRPIAQAFQLTDAMKQDLYREMMGYAALAGSVPEMS